MTTLKKTLRPVHTLIMVIAVCFSSYCCTSCSNNPETAPSSQCKVISEKAHAPTNYTQGFLIHDGFLYEGTGQRGESRLQRIDMETGKVLKEAKLSKALFGEGIVIHNDMIYQLTWKSMKCIVFDVKHMIRRKHFQYKGEGWGLTSNGKEFFMSNGSDELTVRNPEDFKEIRRISVTEFGVPVKNLNELEYINGEIWANVWQTDRIARIDPSSGEIKSWVDCSSLREKLNNEDAEVLNGIAYDSKNKKIWVTGKHWDKMFEIEVN